MASTRTLPAAVAQWAPAARENGTLDVGDLLRAVDREMRALVGRYVGGPAGLWEMSAYHLGWADLGEGPAMPGKHVRPLLTLLTAEAAGGAWQKALPLAAAVELLHGFSLIHDDIQDAGEVRRGRPSVWAKWGTGHAINAGDHLFALAHLAAQQALALAPEGRLEALGLLDTACVRLGEGQYLDMALQQSTEVSLDDYEEMVNGKTAALMGLAAELGGVAAGVDAERRSDFRQFGTHLGLAFQVRDDILGIWGESALTGKSQSDVAGRKKTLPVVLGMCASADLREMFNGPDLDMVAVVQLLERLDVQTACHHRLRVHIAAALDHLKSVGTQGDAGELLRRMALALLPGDAAGRVWAGHPNGERPMPTVGVRQGVRNVE